MLKRSMLIAATAAAAMLAPGAQAASTFSQFTYTGFFHEEAGQFLPNAQIYGYFETEDLNGNGVLERSEVSSFVLNGQQYVGWCGPEVFMCGLFEFSYAPGAALSFSTSWSTDPWSEFGVAAGRAVSGIEVKEYSYWMGNSASYTLRWTEDTLFEISPVPEPATYGMLALGLGVLALSSRRRARAATRAPADAPRPPVISGAHHA
ncbi:PEP-CTERM sorting domain-containing protein [Massilia sp. CCM 8734]|uniref:PEP-CTERM sorting domain-containing protein n=1 Tax=Massilia sp. CCM 8734 TaxID=2609283 RepID=UPI0014221D02|nr:PEP-CTERM sorting domain-containing protein [Massilia sp. CCM 8734]NHZ99490.1 PEP-CTERM sorting domain-containing protein [Massilia sp. CCM 8734]